jgi:hypothetical protein
MTSEHLTAILAKRVMGWQVGPDRFLKGNRSWICRERFQPTKRTQDAHELLMAAHPTEFTLGGGKGKLFWAKVLIGGAHGKAGARNMPLAICLAIARALGIEVEIRD